MTDESAETIVALLLRIESRLEALEKRFDELLPDKVDAAKAPWSGDVDRRVARQPISHDERRKLSGEI